VSTQVRPASEFQDALEHRRRRLAALETYRNDAVLREYISRSLRTSAIVIEDAIAEAKCEIEALEAELEKLP
jgi:hypothetical protein